jgi:hypothetical protein
LLIERFFRRLFHRTTFVRIEIKSIDDSQDNKIYFEANHIEMCVHPACFRS